MPKYRVADRGMGKDRMIGDDRTGREWFAGDAIEESDLGKESFKWMRDQGVIEEVPRGEV